MSNRDEDYEIPRKKKARKVRPDGADISSHDHISGADGTAKTLKRREGDSSKAVRRKPQTGDPKKRKTGESLSGDSIERKKSGKRANGDGSPRKKKVQEEKNSLEEGQKKRRKSEVQNEGTTKSSKKRSLEEEPGRSVKSETLEADAPEITFDTDQTGSRRRRREKRMEDFDDYKEDEMGKKSKKNKTKSVFSFFIKGEKCKYLKNFI